MILEVSRTACKEFDRFDGRSKALFVRKLELLATHPEAALGQGVRHLNPKHARASGAQYYIKSEIDRCIMFNKSGRVVEVVHLAKRNDRALGFSGEW